MLALYEDPEKEWRIEARELVRNIGSTGRPGNTKLAKPDDASSKAAQASHINNYGPKSSKSETGKSRPSAESVDCPSVFYLSAGLMYWAMAGRTNNYKSSRQLAFHFYLAILIK